MDKRKFHLFLKEMKESTPGLESVFESIQDTFEKKIEPITDREKIALISFPEQFLAREVLEDSQWTTKLHIWAENCVPELLRINPIYLIHENSYGDSIILCLIKAACGAYTDVVNYPLIRQILSKQLTYEEKTIDSETGHDIIKLINILDVPDISELSAIDYLIDYAYSTGIFEGTRPDDVLKEMLMNFANNKVD